MDLTIISNTNTVLECGFCGKNHTNKICDYIKITNHIFDSEIPSKAKLTMPKSLQLQILSDGSYSVTTKSLIIRGTQFGPYQALKVPTLDPSINFPLKLFASDFNKDEAYLDTTDENFCSWLIFVSPADYLEEQNLICYQDRGKIFYVAIKDIPPEAALKVWYAPHYAKKMNRSVLGPRPVEPVDPLKNIDINELIKKQQNIVERPIWSCRFCGQIENEVVDFAKHMMKHYVAQLKKSCSLCNSSFNTSKDVRKHLKVVHWSSLPVAEQGPTKVPEITVQKLWKAPKGDPLLTNVNSDTLELPSIEQIDLSVDNQNLLLDSDNLNVENLLNENVKDLDHFNFEIGDNQKQFICDICLKQFGKIKWLVTHMKHHTGEFICLQCLKIFCRRENFTTHLCNNSELTHQCTQCSKCFSQKKYLARHISAIHDKKYCCTTCLKCYHSNRELTDHNCSKRPYADKEKFICPTCDKIFYSIIYLRRHQRIHRNISRNVNSTICEKCGALLKNKNSYYLHMKLHEEPTHSCDLCEKKFNRVDTLKIHQLTHKTNDHEFRCGNCWAAFKCQKNLRYHMKHQHSNRMFTCDICRQDFKSKYYLEKHVKNKHVSKPTETLECFLCPVCDKKIKLRSSLLRHLKKVHSEDLSQINMANIKRAVWCRDEIKKEKEENIGKEIDKILDKPSGEGMSVADKEIVENLVKVLGDFKSGQKSGEDSKEVCLSMPDLTENDQQITLDKNAYILENGTIVQPQEDSKNVIIYVLDQRY